MPDVSQIKKLQEVAQAMVAPGKGILAADESNGTIGKRFEKISVENTEENRRAYRELLFTTPDIGEYISGVIMYDETIRQSASDGRTFVKVLQDVGVLPGIKVDQGTKTMDNSLDEKITDGLEGLSGRLEEYVKLGAQFAKWRAVITIGNGLPSDANIYENAKRLATYAVACQTAGLVPIVEPEVLIDGDHTIEEAGEAGKRTLSVVFNEISKAGVAIDGMILKPSMVTPGKETLPKAPPEAVAKATLDIFRNILPSTLLGVAFLSGGQSEVEATENLNAMNKIGGVPWKLTFSFSRALQNSPMSLWNGKTENVEKAQKAFAHRAKMNSLASLGKYEGENS